MANDNAGDGVQQRMSELMVPIDQSCLLINDEKELIMLACAMMQRSRELLDATIGINGRKTIFKEME
jgi:hypothetical protein